MNAAVASIPDSGTVFLDAYLAPFRPWLDREDVTELIVNRPGEIWIEASGAGMERVTLDAVDDRHIQRLAEQIARVSNQGVNRERPLLAATLPDGARVQFVAPSATRGGWAMAIRRHRLVDLPLSAYDLGALPTAESQSRSIPAQSRCASCRRRCAPGARS